MANTIPIGLTNTLNIPANTPFQLVAPSNGRTNFFILNTGPGNLYLRYNQEPAGVGDPLSLELPVGSEYFTNFPVSGGESNRDGVFVLADAPGNVSVLNLPNPLPGPSQAMMIGGGGGTGQQQSPWAGPINGNGQSLTNALNLSATGNIAAGGRVSASIMGIGTLTPAYALDVVGSVNVTGSFLVNGNPLTAPAVAPVQSAVPPTTWPNGSLWFDSQSLVLYILFNGAWIGV